MSNQRDEIERLRAEIIDALDSANDRPGRISTGISLYGAREAVTRLAEIALSLAGEESSEE